MFNARKVLPILLCLLLIFSLFGCQNQETESAEQPDETDETTDVLFTAGTYTGEADGHNGPITVEVTVSDMEITDVKILSHNESPSISDAALERIPQGVMDQQTLAVDSVSGATVTSDAILVAVTDALTQADADIAALQVKGEEEASEEEDIEMTADVVVVGGGGAGLAAAVTAHENGASVIVLEKMPRLGGNTIYSGGALNAAGSPRQEAQGIEDSVDLHYKQTFEGGDEKGNPELVRILVENAYPGVEWLESLGMEFKEEVFTVLGGLWPRAHKPTTPLGSGFIETYQNYIDNNDGIEVLLDTEVTELVVEDNVVVGVSGRGLSGDVLVHANNGVVLATGGFAKNNDMLNEFNENWPDLGNVMSTNHPGATGDGHAMAEAIGASLIGMEDLQLLPLGDPNTGSLSGNIEQGVENRIFVNKAGDRFVDEGERRDVMTKALLEQEDGLLWIVLDAKNYPNEQVTNNFNETIDELIAQERAFKGDTLEELADQIDVDPEKLVNAVEAFNLAVAEGGPDEFGRTLFDTPIDTAPFYAAPRAPTVHYTIGGVEINEMAEVLSLEGTVIPGLYAAGEVTGGIHGTNRLGGNALADILVFGRIAGENAANQR